MKKIFLLCSVLSLSFSFAQTKNKEIVSDPAAVEDNPRIAKVKPGTSEYDLRAEPMSGSPAQVNNGNQPDENVYPFAGVEVRPEFPGGTQKFLEFAAKNYKMPEEAGLKGKVYVSFVVEKDGSLTDIKVIRDIGYGTGKEAVRVVKLSPKWSPAELNGKKVRSNYALPIPLPFQ